MDVTDKQPVAVPGIPVVRSKDAREQGRGPGTMSEFLHKTCLVSTLRRIGVIQVVRPRGRSAVGRWSFTGCKCFQGWLPYVLLLAYCILVMYSSITISCGYIYLELLSVGIICVSLFGMRAWYRQKFQAMLHTLPLNLENDGQSMQIWCRLAAVAWAVACIIAAAALISAQTGYPHCPRSLKLTKAVLLFMLVVPFTGCLVAWALTCKLLLLAARNTTTAFLTIVRPSPAPVDVSAAHEPLRVETPIMTSVQGGVPAISVTGDVGLRISPAMDETQEFSPASPTLKVPLHRFRDTADAQHHPQFTRASTEFKFQGEAAAQSRLSFSSSAHSVSPTGSEHNETATAWTADVTWSPKKAPESPHPGSRAPSIHWRRLSSASLNRVVPIELERRPRAPSPVSVTSRHTDSAHDTLLDAPVATLRRLRAALYTTSESYQSTLAVGAALYVTMVVLSILFAVRDGAVQLLMLSGFASGCAFTMLFCAARVTQAASAILPQVCRCSNPVIVQAVERNSAIMALLVGTSPSSDCLQLFGSTITIAASVKLASLVFSALLFAARYTM